jgi:hypothetical protein
VSLLQASISSKSFFLFARSRLFFHFKHEAGFLVKALPALANHHGPFVKSEGSINQLALIPKLFLRAPSLLQATLHCCGSGRFYAVAAKTLRIPQN